MQFLTYLCFCCLCFSGHVQKIFLWLMWKFFLFYFRSFTASCFMFVFNWFWVGLCAQCVTGVHFHCFARGSSVLPAPFVEETILSQLAVFVFLVKDQLMVHEWIYVGALYSVPFAYMSLCWYHTVLVTIISYFESKKCDIPSFFLFSFSFVMITLVIWDLF